GASGEPAVDGGAQRAGRARARRHVGGLRPAAEARPGLRAHPVLAGRRAWGCVSRPRKRDPGSALIPCSQADERVVITMSSHLDPSCTYTKGIEITASGVTLDCLNGLVRAPEGVTAVESHAHTPTDVALSDVTIKRCRVEGFTNTVKVTRDGFR